MESVKPNLTTTLCAVVCAAAVLAGTTLLADGVSRSRLYRQSQVFRAIAAQDQLNLVSVVQDGELRSLLTHFIAAVTNAYVNFEMIPYNEGQTFVAVLQSMSGGVHIERIEYQRRNLRMEGEADTPETYQHFVEALRGTQHFQGVSGHSYLTVEDTVHFEIECASIYQGNGIPLPVGN